MFGATWTAENYHTDIVAKSLDSVLKNVVNNAKDAAAVYEECVHSACQSIRENNDLKDPFKLLEFQIGVVVRGLTRFQTQRSSHHRSLEEHHRFCDEVAHSLSGTPYHITVRSSSDPPDKTISFSRECGEVGAPKNVYVEVVFAKDLPLETTMVIQRDFAEKFSVPALLQTPLYARFLAALPSLFFGTYDHLLEWVSVSCSILSYSYLNTMGTVPFWRERNYIMRNWRSPRSQSARSHVVNGKHGYTQVRQGLERRKETGDNDTIYRSIPKTIIVGFTIH